MPPHSNSDAWPSLIKTSGNELSNDVCHHTTEHAPPSRRTLCNPPDASDTRKTPKSPTAERTQTHATAIGRRSDRDPHTPNKPAEHLCGAESEPSTRVP